MISDPSKLEELLLTVGLAYRDMIILHSDRDPATIQQPLPDYMNASGSHLTRRIKDVCDTILRTTSEEIKCHPFKTPLVVHTKPTAHGSRNKHKPGRKLSGVQNAAHLATAAVPTKQGPPRKNSTNSPTTQRGESPIILPPVRPRKRNRNELEPIDLDEDSVRFTLLCYWWFLTL